jgi:hypothetical protein
MNRKLIASLFAGSALFVAQGALAQQNWGHSYNSYNSYNSDYERIKERQARQQERIRSADARGELRRGELRRLLDEQRMIRDKERAFLSDGVLTRRELAELDRDLDVASQNIRRLAHNDRVAGRAYSEYRY